jgi:hypothetical protein
MDRRNFLRPAAVAAASSVATGLLHVGRHIADRGFLKPAESSEVGCFRHDRGRFPDVAVGKLTRCPSSLTGRTGFGLRAQMTQRQELSPKVGEGVNRGRRHIVGVFEPPLLHRRSDMPCPTIALSN